MFLRRISILLNERIELLILGCEILLAGKNLAKAVIFLAVRKGCGCIMIVTYYWQGESPEVLLLILWLTYCEAP
jgi:hypothetical protein